MPQGTLQIHTENILPIIKKWLYSDRDIFVRELVSNACDAIHKVKFLRDQNQAEATDDEFRVEIKIDRENRTLTFSDTGIGMDRQEVEKYIAQVAFSGAEDFVQKYSQNAEKDQIIGHFGLGFYSSYMIAQKVEIQTLSYREGAEAVFWSCDGSPTYEIDRGNRQERGTSITLFVDQDNDGFLEEARLSQILKRYCSFLPFPIYLNEEQINVKEPLWIKPASECSKQDYLDFYGHLYPHEEPPLFWVHLNVDYPFNLRGILYFSKWKKQFDMSKSNIHLYCNRVFVADHCQDIVPEYLTMLKGAIDSPDIPLNVSRSSLQMDRTVRQLATHISKKVADRLAHLCQTDRDHFIECWPDIEIVTKLGAMQDDKFYKAVKQCLIWKNLEGKWTTAEEYLERHREDYKDKIFYTKGEEQATHLLDLYSSKNIEVLCTNELIDQGVFNLLEKELSPAKFQRTDGALDDLLLDETREKTLLDSEGKTEATRLADLVRAKLNKTQVEVVAKSLNSDHVPGLVVIDEQGRRMRDYMAQVNPQFDMAMLSGMEKRTFVVNTNHALVQALPKIAERDQQLADELVQQMYDLALLSQKELAPNQLNTFVDRSNALLGALAKAFN